MSEFFTGFILGVFALMIGLIMTGDAPKQKIKEWQQQIIEHNCGYYDPKTKEFKFGQLK
jgi:hypothetical protein